MSNKDNNNNNNSSSISSNKGWMSTFSDQFSQIKDVITSENGGYGDDDDEYERRNGDDDDDDDEVFILRAEALKYKQEITQLEQRILEFEQREVDISKEYSLILKEKNNEILNLKNVNENLKSSLISPPINKSPSVESSNSNKLVDENSQNKQQNLFDNESLGIPLEHDDLGDNNIDDINNKTITNDSTTNNNNNNNTNDIEKIKEDYQNQLSSIQDSHQEKLYNLTLKIEQLELQLSFFDDEKLKFETENSQLLTINENLNSNIKELNEKIDELTSVTPTAITTAASTSPPSSSESSESTVTAETTTGLNENEQKQQEEIQEKLAQINTLKEQVNKSNKELARLRQHLIDMEDQHTTLDLENEEKISNLEQLLKKSMEQNSNLQIMNDQIIKLSNELNEKEEQLKQSNRQLNNLNSVLEQFQADQDVTIQNEVIHLEKLLEQSNFEIEQLKKDKLDYLALQKKYSDSQDQIQLLYQDIQSKTFDFIKLKEDIEPLKAAFDKNILRLGDMCLQEQESVDKRVVSKLFLNYFRGNKKSEILELIAKILGFSDSEKISIGLTKKNQWSLLPPFFGGQANNGENGDNGEKPLAEMWIEFLLKESSGENLNDINNGNNNNNNNNNNSNSNGNSILQSYNNISNPTPFSTPVKQPPPSFQPQQPPPSPSTPYKSTSNNYFSVGTPGGNGKQKTTTIFDGDMSETPFK